MYYYVARYYDPALARFRGLCAPELRALPALERFLFHGCEREGKRADTIIPEPGSSQAYDRYAYVNGNPVKYNDPSGHRLWDGITGDTGSGGDYDSYAYTVYYELHTEQERQENRQTLETVVDVTTTVVGVLNEPADWLITGAYCVSGDCSPWMFVGLLPVVPSSLGKHVDDVIEIGKKAPIVIGENMSERVIPFAKEIGGTYYKPWKMDLFEMDLALKRDERWIRNIVKEGREIIDIGIDKTRQTRSPFYKRENRVLDELRYGVTKYEIQ